MKTGHYVVVRYIADPARNEALNVGIALWDDTTYRVRIDLDAAHRAIRDNRHIARDALDSLQKSLEEEIAMHWNQSNASATWLDKWLSSQRGFPVALTDARFVALESQHQGEVDAYELALSRLVARIVHPGRSARRVEPDRTGKAAALFSLRRALKQLINDRAVSQHHEFAGAQTKSGIPRQVDFFANHGANTALEAFGIGRAAPRAIITAADAEAHKIEDIRERNAGVKFAVFFPTDEEQHTAQSRLDARAQAARILSDAGANFVSSAEEAQTMIQAAVARAQ